MPSGITVQCTFLDLAEFQAGMDELIARSTTVGREFVEAGSELLVQRMKAKARVRSGANRDSIGIDSIVEGAGTVTAKSGPRTAYGRREELGFHGTDSAGRTYKRDVGHEYVTPVVENSGPDLQTMYETMLTEALEL